MLDFVRDIYTSFRQTSLERVKSPFLGAFVFSWIGFNWQMLAIALFSKKEIEERLEIINKNYDIGNYLLAPICTTALIVILLPQINKFITRIQDKPNSDTLQLNLSSKINIAKLQQSLAESEARKKLAEKKEERFIEESIHAIKASYDKAMEDINKKEDEINNLLKAENELHSQLAKIESKFNVEQESKSQLQNDLIVERDNNRTLGDQIIKTSAELQQAMVNLSLSKESYEKTLSNYNELKNKYEIREEAIRNNRARYPYLIDLTNDNGSSILRFSKEAESKLDALNNEIRLRAVNNKK